jgi:hypothetical protein
LGVAFLSIAGFETHAALAEPLGPSSRRTGLVISEVMYHPLPRPDGRNPEFIELYNSEASSADISGYRLAGDVDFVFPTNTVLPALSFLVVAPAPADVQAIYGINGVLGPFGNGTNSLPNDEGGVRLRSKSGGVLLQVHYADTPPWPAAADGAGHSLVLAKPSLGEGDPNAWAPSLLIGGSPGVREPANNDPLNEVLINEFLAHTDDPEVDYIELYNHSNQPIDLSGCILTDDPLTNKFIVPTNTSILPRGFVYFAQTNLNFALSAAGETIYFKNAAQTRVIDAVRFGGQENGVTTGRFPDGADPFYRLVAGTRGAPNAGIRVSDVVINELMYHPITDDPDDQYVELYNRSTNPVALGGWKLGDAIRFTFPSNTVIAPNGYLVVAKNAAHLLTNYTTLTGSNTLGNFDGTLSGGGERLVLTMPDTIIVTNSTGLVETNVIAIAVDEVTYGTGGRWGQWADGGGSSLELIDARANHRLAANWADSDETQKSQWTVIEHTGVLDNGSGTPDELQMLLQGAGECLVDAVEVVDSGGVNRINNSSFETGASGWVTEGTQSQSGLETSEGFLGTQSFHVRAVARGDDEVNRIRALLTTPLTAGSTATIRARARWLRGHPELLLRLRGNHLEAFGRMNLPPNLGTPGARNSRAAANSGPGVYEVSHSPILPAANQAVVVSARVHDPDGIASIQLNYRIDPNAVYATANMVDNGTGGDAIAGDGLYSATIPGQPSGAIIAFFIQAVDNFSPAATARFPPDAPARECLVRFGESRPSGSFGTYRLWMTQATFNTWTSRHKLNNAPLDVTFVYNDLRVIYNLGALYAGSPYISPSYSTPSGNLCGYTGAFPVDDRFLGTTDFVLDWPGRDNTAIEEQLSYWIADQMGLPNNYRRFIHLHVNGVTEQARGSIYEDVQQPGSEIVKEWVPDDSDGQLFKIERWFEFSDAGALLSDPQPRLQLYTTTGGVKKLARYRWNWLPRAVKDSANDYTNLFALVDAVNAPSPEPYTSQTEALADIEEMMGIFAVEHIVNNFDSWGHEIGKNMYAYKPEHGKWLTFMFDIDWVMLASAAHNSYSPTSPLFTPTDDPVVGRMYNHPPFRRAYFRAVKKAVDGPLLAANINPWMDAKYSALVANAVTRSAGQTLTAPTAVKTWISQRRNYLVQQLAAIATNFAITSNGGADFSASTNSVTLTGTAPIEVTSLKVNGTDYPVTWTSVTNWALRVALSGGTNTFTVEAFDYNGNLLTAGTSIINVSFTGASEPPQGRVVINEIMYNPVVPKASFLELFNSSPVSTFDLSNWRFDGADFTFPPGALIAPGGFVVIAKDRATFAATYGGTIPLAGEFAGQLRNTGETLRLIKPGPTAAEDIVIDEVTYSGALPWPEAANGTGSSLQLIDPAQDNSRVANWSAALVNTSTNFAPQWQRVTITGTASTSRLYIYMDSPGDVYLDDLSLVAGGTPDVGANFINNGNFETAFPGPWTVSANLTGSTDSSAVKHSGNASLHVVSSAAGSTLGSSIWQDMGPLVTNATYTLSYWYLPSTNGNVLTIRLSGNGLRSDQNIQPVQNPSSTLYTPGAPNSVRTALAPFPLLWINEIEPENITGLADNAGERDPWVELYNSGTNAVNLNGWFLTDNYTNLTHWAFPSNTAINPGGFLIVWLDGQPNQTTANALHTSFRVPTGTGSLALVFPINSQPTVLDYVNYAALPADRSFGLYPDGQTSARQIFYITTPGGPNNNAAPALPLFINEWMAANTAALADPADGHFDDWFEIFNPNSVAVDLTGFTLTDNLTNSSARWPIPAGTRIPARGFLLVWADNDTNQNTNSTDLHANFKLDKTGDTIGLFAPNGSLVDAATFAAQTNDVSEGRWPDGAANTYFMPTPTPRATNVIPNTPPTEIQVLSTTVNGDGDIVITWSAENSRTYRVQYKDDLNAPAWSELSDVTASSPVASATEVTSAGAQRFYRIQLVNP